MTSPDTFRVELCKEQLVFSAAHFITFDDEEGREVCERLHGHNYRVRCEIAGPLNRQGYVVDFIALRDGLAGIVARLDHHVLLPTLHPRIRVESCESSVTASFEDRRWSFPSEDAVLLPMPNTTAELLAGWIAEELIRGAGRMLDSADEISVGVDENGGQWGWCRRRLSPGAQDV